MTKKQLQEEFSALLIRSSLRGKFEISEVVEAHNLTFIHAATLCLLEPGKSLPMNSLSTFLGCTPPNVSSIIERLVDESFVAREESADDRRVKTVSLTTEGLRLREELLRVAMSIRLPGIDTLSKSELDSMIAIFNKATQDIQNPFQLYSK